MKRALAWLFRWPLVWTEDTDGDVRLRRVYLTPFGRQMVESILYRDVTLCADGTTTGCCFVRRWKPANRRAEALFEKTT